MSDTWGDISGDFSHQMQHSPNLPLPQPILAEDEPECGDSEYEPSRPSKRKMTKTTTMSGGKRSRKANRAQFLGAEWDSWVDKNGALKKLVRELIAGKRELSDQMLLENVRCTYCRETGKMEDDLGGEDVGNISGAVENIKLYLEHRRKNNEASKKCREGGRNDKAALQDRFQALQAQLEERDGQLREARAQLGEKDAQLQRALAENEELRRENSAWKAVEAEEGSSAVGLIPGIPDVIGSEFVELTLHGGTAPMITHNNHDGEWSNAGLCLDNLNFPVEVERIAEPADSVLTGELAVEERLQLLQQN